MRLTAGGFLAEVKCDETTVSGYMFYISTRRVGGGGATRSESVDWYHTKTINIHVQHMTYID